MFIKETTRQLHSSESRIQENIDFETIHIIFDFQNKYQTSIFSLAVFKLGWTATIGRHHYLWKHRPIDLRTRIACTNYDWAPKWVWFLFISPALSWAIGRKPGSKWWQDWFSFPIDDRPAPGPHHYPQFSEDIEREFFGTDF